MAIGTPNKMKPVSNKPELKNGSVEAVKHDVAGFDVATELSAAGLDLVFLGEVSEKANERPQEFGSSQSQAAQGANAGDDKAAAKNKRYLQKREQLINSNPTEEKMIREIKSVLDRKMTKLVAEESKLRSQGLKKIDKYANVVAKIRNLNRLLAEVLESGYRALKALWLRIVHGII